MRRTRLNDGWSVRSTVGPFAELSGEAAEWEPVMLPHDAMLAAGRAATATPASGYFVGGSWDYRRAITLAAEDAGRTVELQFEAVYRDAVVSVNGSVAGHRPYGYSTFTVPIDHLVRFGGENEIGVRARAGNDSRWYSGAGIYRHVWLLEAGPVHLPADGLDVRTPEVDEDGATVTVAAEVRNRSQTTAVVQVAVELLDPTGAVVAVAEAPVTVFPNEMVRARQRLFVERPRRWGPGHPDLYTCRVILRSGEEVLDEESTAFGIRTITVDPRRGLRVNGEPTKLRGTCVHHDNGPIGAATFDRAEERRVELLQAAGFNAIRASHGPMSNAMLDACDQLGVLVMDETFDMWRQFKTADDYALRFDAWWEADVEAMVRKDRNHPSVICYSIGNEIPDGSTEVGLQTSRALAAKVRDLDNTRLICQAVTGMLVGGPDLMAEIRATAGAALTEETGVNTAAVTLADIMNDAMTSDVVAAKTEEAFAHLDVAGYNYMDLRYEIDAERYPNRVIAATETHASAMTNAWARVIAHPSVIGDFTWTGWDYLGEAGIGRTEYGEERPMLGMSAFHGDFPALTAWCGDIDITGHRRPQSHHREIVFGLDAGPHLVVEPPEHHGKVLVHASPWAWPDVVPNWTWDGHEGAPISVHVYAAADEVELMLDGTSLGRTKANDDQPFTFAFDTTYRPGILEAVAWRGAEEIGRTTLRTATGDVRIDAQVDRSEIRADGTDLAFVELTLVDGAGTVFVRQDRPVTIEVDGPGVLQGFSSANPVTDEPFTEPTHTTFGGRALAVIRPTDDGTITVTATADGCGPAIVTVVARAGPESS